MFSNRLYAALLAIAVVIPSASNAQRAADAARLTAEARKKAAMAKRVPVTLALVDALDAPGNISAVVVRAPGGGAPGDTIILRSSATGADLSAAVLHLMILRDRSGDTASTSATFRVPAANGAARLGGLPNADVVLARLQSSTPQASAAYGTMRTREIYLPGKAMRDAARGKPLTR